MHPLTESEKTVLINLARNAMEAAVRGESGPTIELEKYSVRLQQDGASFVTLTRFGLLRGCIGALEAYQPLVQDVCEHAVAAALEDYRFTPVRRDELKQLEIEISVLTTATPLEYKAPDDLQFLLRSGVDGVILRDGDRRATFLPQVWEQLPNLEDFLNHLCLKMGRPENYWHTNKLQVETYQVEEFHE